MERSQKTEVKRELLLALMLLTIFVSLLVTYTVIGAIDSSVQERSAITSPTGLVVDEGIGGGRIAVTVLSPPKESSGENGADEDQ